MPPTATPRLHPQAPRSPAICLPNRFYLKATVLEDQPSRMTILHDWASGTPESTREVPNISRTPMGNTLAVGSPRAQSKQPTHGCEWMVMASSRCQQCSRRIGGGGVLTEGTDSLPSIPLPAHPGHLSIPSHSRLMEADPTDGDGRRRPPP